MKGTINKAFRIGLPIVLGGAILWWMYRGFQWEEVQEALSVDMRWGWMLLSFPFGILAQVFRGLRWRQMLQPLGKQPRRWSCVRAIFLSYGSSLVVPRVGELLRCGVLLRDDDIRVSRSLGTVVTERVVDVVLILLLTFITVVWQVPVFVRFMGRTGMSLESILHSFSLTGYIVTAACAIGVALMLWYMLRRFHFFERSRQILKDLVDGLFSIRHVQQKGLFWFYSIGIWVCYYLHFYLTFYCFSYTEGLGPMAALVAFVVGTFAVIVPTPNGAGPWHFAVKTVLMLYGVESNDGAMFVLIVHSIQTLLVAALGVVGLIGPVSRKAS